MSSPLRFALRGLLLAVNPANEMFDTWRGSSRCLEVVRVGGVGEVGKLLVFDCLIDVVRTVGSAITTGNGRNFRLERVSVTSAKRLCKRLQLEHFIRALGLITTAQRNVVPSWTVTK